MDRRAGQNKVFRYLISLVLVVAATLLGNLVEKVIVPANIVFFYLLTVIITAILWGKGSAIVTSILSVLAFDYEG